MNENEIMQKLALAWATEVFRKTYLEKLPADCHRLTDSEASDSLAYFRELYQEALNIYSSYPKHFFEDEV